MGITHVRQTGQVSFLKFEIAVETAEHLFANVKPCSTRRLYEFLVQVKKISIVYEGIVGVYQQSQETPGQDN